MEDIVITIEEESETVISVEPEPEIVIELEPIENLYSGERWGGKLPDFLTMYNLAKI